MKIFKLLINLYLKLYVKLNIILIKIKIIYLQLYFIMRRIILNLTLSKISIPSHAKHIGSAANQLPKVCSATLPSVGTAEHKILIILSILSSIFFQYCFFKKLYYWIFKIQYIINNIDLVINKINENINNISYINIVIILLFIIYFFLITHRALIIVKLFKLSLIKSLLIKFILNYNEDLNLIIKEMLNDKDNSSLPSNSSSSYSTSKEIIEEDIDFDKDSESIEIETEKHKELMKSIEFENFNDITQKEQSNYIYQQMYNKAIEPNQPLIDWLIISTLNNTNGNKSDIDDYINSNLNVIQKEERDSQLMTHAFERTRPYPIKRIDPSPYAFPAYMPMKKRMDEWESQELIDAMNVMKNETENINALQQVDACFAPEGTEGTEGTEGSIAENKNVLQEQEQNSESSTET